MRALSVGLLWLLTVGSVSARNELLATKADYYVLVEKLQYSGAHLDGEPRRIWNAIGDALKSAGDELAIPFSQHVHKADVEMLLARLGSRDAVTEAIQNAERVVQEFEPELDELMKCVMANMTMVGCDFSSKWEHLLHLVSVKTNMTGGTVHMPHGIGSRPSAPVANNNFHSGHRLAGRLGEGVMTQSRRLMMWISITALYLIRAFQLSGIERARRHEAEAQRRQRWATIFMVYPEYEEWKTSLNEHDDVILLVNDLCGQMYPNKYMPYKFEGKTWNDMTMTDLDQIWANPFWTPRSGRAMKQTLEYLNKLDPLLRDCWQSAQDKYVEYRQFDLKTAVPRFAVAFFALTLFSFTSNAAANPCAKMNMEGLYCSNRNHFGSVCVKTCLGNQTLDLSNGHGQMVVCGDQGQWQGPPLAECKLVQHDPSFR